ncbi:hypothetical protein EW563_14920 [Salmonella enterica subsp. enterica serovar Typhimurium]|uniref:Polymerase nucleotidyl transferase domain-containing protein n=1 Tax=Salmonella enterica subsp. enterica serovar Altona TaxID=1151173 RepID=A0A724UIX9_SALET|nr:hypothetical protein [Salmonella enterica subsp. enterica serovar Altona]EAY3325733.1 hypothetical protein [Salmonella enterica subsp. enterica serovar Typhimurium]EDJ1522495.1 hypothetical protein [Salmonella enterica]EDV9379071.1 hypothetical protein [Salmonella enterica subsp. enterica]HBM0080305.1 hypothetical protein [Salmonella enterica subsp. enterica serovar Brikama]
MEYIDFLEKYNSIKECINYSNDKISVIKQDITRLFTDVSDEFEFTIITTGSFGRREASDESDLDLFIFCSTQAAKEFIESKGHDLSELINKHVSKDSGSTGTFGSDAIEIFENVLKNIGGTQDKNESLTRRMLLLLEGYPLYGEAVFEKYRNTLIDKYIDSTSEGSNRIDKFLLNDIIRYYRTITTDFQYKVEEDGKSWGLRNIKLRFSRKLLYFAGILTVAEVISDKLHSERTKSISEHFNKPALERIFEITKEKSSPQCLELLHEIFSKYEIFLYSICKPENRKELENIKMKTDRLDSVLYNTLSTESNIFTDKLHELLTCLYEKEHPIYSSLVF